MVRQLTHVKRERVHAERKPTQVRRTLHMQKDVAYLGLEP